MRINPAANLPNPASETNAKSADVADAGSENGFFAQMGHILNQDNGHNNARLDAAEDARRANQDGNNQQAGSSRTLHENKAAAQNTPDSMTQLFISGDSADPASRDAAAIHASGKSNGTVRPTEVETAPLQTSEDDKKVDALIPVFLCVGDPAFAIENAPADLTLQPQATGLTGKMAEMTLTDISAKVSRDLGKAGIDSNKGISLTDGRNTNLNGNLGKPDILKESAGSETWATTALQDKEQNGQLNFEFIAAKASESGPAIATLSMLASRMQNRSFADSFELSGGEESQNEISAATPGRDALKLMQAFPENADLANVSAGRGQAANSSGLWTAVQGKEHAQSNPGQSQLLSEERQPQAQFFFASGPAMNSEQAGAVNAANAQTSTAQAPEFIAQLANQIRIQVRDGNGEIRIQLKPDGFGHLEIRAETTIHGVLARISTESAAVKSYLENNLQMLQQTLQDQGLKIDRIHIVVQDALDAQSSSGFTAQFGHAGSGQNGREAQIAAGKAGTVSASSMEEAIPDAASWLALNPNNRFYTVA